MIEFIIIYHNSPQDTCCLARSSKSLGLWPNGMAFPRQGKDCRFDSDQLHQMIISKLTILLTIAFQESEGPFDIEATYTDHVEHKTLTKDQIGELSDIKGVIIIDIRKPSGERRWHHRTVNDRRINR